MPSRETSPPAAASSISAEAHDRALRLCRKWDKDCDGAIGREELGEALKEIFPDCSADDVEKVMQAVDVNRDGLMQYNEVLEWLRLPPHEKRCFEDSLRSYIRGYSSTVPPALPPFGDVGAVAGGLDEKVLRSFVHPLLGRFRVVAEAVRSASAPPEAVRVRLLSRGVRASAGEAACTVALQREASGGQTIDASVRAADFAGDGARRLLPALQHYGEVQLCILEAFCSATVAADKAAKPPRLRLEPPAELGRDPGGVPPPGIYWSATALALARLSPSKQRKVANAYIDVCVGSRGAAPEYEEVLDTKVRAAIAPVGSPTLGETALPQRKGGYSWVRHDNDLEARLCRLQAFMLSQRVAWAGGYEVTGGGTPKPVALTQVERMLLATSTRIAETMASNTTADPAPVRPTQLRSPADLGLPERSTAMEVASALTAKGKQVAAVNAASAYSVGGGCSSGGRHALEEAWCITSTLFRSLAAAKAADLAEPSIMGARGLPPRHVPALGCVVSPAVEIFREGTERGYGLLDEPVRLCGVLSVAMFNRNPSVSDSPLDCPEDPTTYVAQIQAKLESVVFAAADLGADVLVVPDVGCGVFQNDPLVVGGCLGSVLRRRSGRISEVVVLSGAHQGFAAACQRAFRGEDPRESCPHGANCGQLSDPFHAARMAHGGASADTETALVALAANPEEVKKPMCRYGARCTIRKPKHLADFLHPPPGDTIPWPQVLEKADANPIMECPPAADESPANPVVAPRAAAAEAAQPPSPPPVSPRPNPAVSPQAAAAPPQPAAPAAPVPPAARPAGPGAGAGVPAAMLGSTGTNMGRPMCRYGEACYNKRSQHLKDFAHPWLEGTETPKQMKERGDMALVHEMLNYAKCGKWPEVKAILRRRPDLVNGRPDVRNFGLVHHAAWQIRMDDMESLVQDFGADVNARTKDGKTPEDVLYESEQLDDLGVPERARAAALRMWLRRRTGGWQSDASPTSAAAAASPAGTAVAAGATAMSPAVASALAGAFAGAAAASSAPTPELKPAGAVLTVCSCLNMRLEGNYIELTKAHNGLPVYWKVAPGGGPAGHYIYYNFRTDLGWVVDTDLSDSKEPLAYLGVSQCGADPSAKAYGEAWKVHCISRMAGGYYSRDVVMRIKR